MAMKVCQRDTFLYWCVHVLIWTVIALPTVIFVLRISHPIHEEEQTKFNGTDDGNRTVLNRKGDCSKYSKENCQLSASLNQSHNLTLGNDQEISEVFSSVLFSRNRSKCKSLLFKVFSIHKCTRCNNSVDNATSSYFHNISHEFCKNCSITPTDSSLMSNIQYQWLKSLPCFPQSSALLTNETGSSTPKNVSCSKELIKDANGTCRVPCDWSFMSKTVRDTYYAVMVLNLWVALIAAVITIGTLASFKLMRTFPHIVRFYILISSILYAATSLLPLRIGLSKIYCGSEQFWNEKGHTSKLTVLEGATSHYFFLVFCFWCCCYVINTYSVIVKGLQNVFLHKTKHHIIQFLVCSMFPALLVTINMAMKPPGYKSLFLDRMTSVFTSPVIGYITFTLPIQITLGVAISLLWSLIRFVRKVRKNKTTVQAIRPDEDTKAFLHAEQQFTKLAVLFIVTVAVVLSSEIFITYQNEKYIHEVEEYFHCIQQLSKNCYKPTARIFFLSSFKVCGPGIFCLLNFLLLFFNKDTRNVWKTWIMWIYNKLTCRQIKKPSTDNATASTLPCNTGTRSRSGTADTMYSLNSLSRLGKFEIFPDHFQPADGTSGQGAKTSSFTGETHTAKNNKFSISRSSVEECILSPTTIESSISDHSDE